MISIVFPWIEPTSPIFSDAPNLRLLLRLASITAGQRTRAYRSINHCIHACETLKRSGSEQRQETLGVNREWAIAAQMHPAKNNKYICSRQGMLGNVRSAMPRFLVYILHPYRRLGTDRVACVSLNCQQWIIFAAGAGSLSSAQPSSNTSIVGLLYQPPYQTLHSIDLHRPTYHLPVPADKICEVKYICRNGGSAFRHASVNGGYSPDAAENEQAKTRGKWRALPI